MSRIALQGLKRGDRWVAVFAPIVIWIFELPLNQEIRAVKGNCSPPLGQNAITSAMPTDPLAGAWAGTARSSRHSVRRGA